MKRKPEILNLIDSYIARVNYLRPQIKWANYNELTIKLKEYQEMLNIKQEVPTKWFSENCINGKSVQGEIFEYLNSIDGELLSISIRLRNLNTTNSYNQISSSTTHYKPFVKNAKYQLEQLGFKPFNQTEYRNEYINLDKIIVSLIYQRYDPPEVYIKRENDEKYLRFGPMLELVVNGSKTIWDKHSGENSQYFNYSKFEYYRELMDSVYEKLNRKEDFVKQYNEEINELYEQMKSDL